MAGQIGNEDLQAQFRKRSCKVFHDNLVPADSVKQNHRPGIWSCRQIGTPQHDQIHAASGRVDHIARFCIAARRVERDNDPHDQAKNSSNSLKNLIFFIQAGCSEDSQIGERDKLMNRDGLAVVPLLSANMENLCSKRLSHWKK
jgi:hypothetical protein